MTIVFTDEFNVEEQSSTAYRQFIERLRPKLAAKYSHNLPVLPLQENPPTRWMDLILRTKDRAITLRIRLSNLYLDGFRMETSSGTWWEFGSDTTVPRPPHLIPGSSFLGFTGEYGSLENVAGVRLNTISLGQQPIRGAVNALDNTATDRSSKARSLIIVIRMICESIRYVRISNHIATNFTGTSGFLPETWMSTLETNWGRLSFDLLAKDANPEYRFRPLPINATEINTVEQAVAILGVLLGGATAEVMLENDNIIGRLTISNGVSEFESVLVRKTTMEEAGESISLSTSVVAVPLNSALTISYDDETTARFPAQLAGISEKIISGKHGEIKVKVNWNN